MKTLKQKTVSGFKWLLVNNVLQKAISVATFAILARFLSPLDFGLFAMAFVAIDGLGLFKTFGLDASIVQKKDCPDEANHTAFILIMALSIAVFFICFAVAPLAGQFFNNPQLASVVRALGVVFFVGGSARVPSAILTRHLRFRLISIIDLIGSTVNCVFAVIFALINPSVWSLVGAYIIKHGVVMSLSWYLSGYRFRWHFDWKQAKELLNFGRFMMGLSILWYIGANINNLVIGKMLGAAAVGYFALAGNIGNFINTHFTHVISRVMFPAYSQIQDDRERVRRAFLKTVKYITMLTLPFSVGLICLAEEFVLTLYGEKWLSIVPLIRLLGFGQILGPLSIACGSLFRGCGKPEYDFRLNLAALAIHLPMVILLTQRWGLLGTVISGLITLIVLTPIEFWLMWKLTGLRINDLLKQLAPAAVCSLIMLIVIQGFKMLIRIYPILSGLEPHYLVLLVVLSFIGVATYAVSFFVVDRPASLEVKRMIFNLEGA